jgi:Zn-finger nucleic acid-binding protein
MPTSEAKTLNCRTCGAAVSGDQTSCGYCGARVATVACPKCFGMMFAGSRHCPHCGAEASRGPVDEATGLACPDCEVSLATVHLGQTPINECGRCCGIWLETQTFDRICTDSERQTAVLGKPIAQEIDVKREWRYVPCPRCRRLMQRVNFAGQSGVIIDICREHGAWFEREELRKIVEFIRAGGMAEARQTQLERLEHERRRLERERAEMHSSPVDPALWGASNHHSTGPTLADAFVAAGNLLGLLKNWR